MRTRDTMEPRCGRMSTSPSVCSRASASETGNRDTPEPLADGALVEDFAGLELERDDGAAQFGGDGGRGVSALR